jgi:hypothetical protein
MNLQEIFYILAIAFFISGWIVFITLGVVGFLLYKRLQQLQAKVEGIGTSLPYLGIALPLVGKVFRWWRRR